MKVYADSSLLVSAFTTETASEAARQWLGGLPEDALLTSYWCRAEIVSALAMKARGGEISQSLAVMIAREIASMLTHSATPIAINDAALMAAAELIERSPLPLRAPDALHLAIAQSGGAIVWTLDVDMAKAGAALDLGTRLLS
ncbi:type II toxin-antitoxin system VapC family toxin [Sphingomonas sp. GlSt437]|uniref:type II toxin-antitoxin system VapC family toxin n=1 Tax=Sphingomonas sp. GlSt437 TaxID=3389970 RepID=UPI003A89A8B5